MPSSTFLRRCWIGLGSLAVLTACPGFDRVAQPNDPPFASAGDDVLVGGGEQVTLQGFADDLEGDPLTFQWEQVGGEPVQLSDPTNPEVTFVAPLASQTLVFSLTASDGFDVSEADLVRVEVRFNRAPVANAGGAREVRNLDSITLSGAGDDADGDSIRGYLWTVSAGPPGSDLGTRLSGAETKNPVFTPDRRGQYTLSLVVSDDLSSSDPDFVVIDALNNPPVADAGEPIEAAAGTSLTLVGSASDRDGDRDFSWTWTVASLPNGADFSLFNARTATATFVPRTRGTYVLELKANDGQDDSISSELIVSATNNPPQASAGSDLWIPNRSEVTLAGAGSDPDGDPITFRWTLSGRPPGSTYTITDAGSASARFTPLDRGTYVLVVEVSDGVATSTDTVTVNAGNNAPEADAGLDVIGVTVGEFVTLNALMSSDADGDVLAYQWRQLGGTAVTGNFTSGTPTFRAPNVLGALLFELIVSDGVESSAPSTVRVVVDNLPPLASVVSANLSAAGGASVGMDGSPSSDPNGDPIAGYEWTQVSGPAVNLSGGGSATPSFTAPSVDPVAGDLLVFSLRVTDGKAFSAPVLVEVRLLPSEAQFVFVAPAPFGNDANAGTRAAPRATVSSAAILAAAGNRSVALAAGDYVDAATLELGVSVYGGYDASTWVRDPETTPSTIESFGMGYAIRYGSIGSGTTVIDGVRINASEFGTIQVQPGMMPPTQFSSALFCDACRDLIVRDCDLGVTTMNPFGPAEAPLVISNASGSILVENNRIETSVGMERVRTGIIAGGGSAAVTLRSNQITIRQETQDPFVPAALTLGPLSGALVDGNVITVEDGPNCMGPVLLGIQGDSLQQSTIVNNVISMRNTFCMGSIMIDLRFDSDGSVVSNNTMSGAPRQQNSDKNGVRIELAPTESALVANNYFHELNIGYLEYARSSNPSYPLLRANAFHRVDALYFDMTAGLVNTISAIEALPMANAGAPVNAGNLEVDCQVDFASASYELDRASVCIDAGERLSGVPTQDLYRRSRPEDWSAVVNFADGTDIGATEARP